MGKKKAVICGLVTGAALEASLVLGRLLMDRGQRGLLWSLAELLLGWGGFGLLYYFLWNFEGSGGGRGFRTEGKKR